MQNKVMCNMWFLMCKVYLLMFIFNKTEIPINLLIINFSIILKHNLTEHQI
jgi:hypothetical protein